MKKKLLSLALTAAMLMSLVPAAFAVSMPAATTKTYTLTDEYISSEIQGLEVTVTLDGYLGTLDMQEVGIEDEILAGFGYVPDMPNWDWTNYPGVTNPRPVYVLKSGSDVKFTINNPDASYNYCFDPNMDPNEFPYDDSAGGQIYSCEFGEPYGINTFISANGDGTATLTAGGIYSAQARKLSETSYAYTAKDGLYTFSFNAKNKADSADGVTWWPTDSVARYVLGTFLFISEEQVAEYEATGTMTFHKDNYEFIGTYSHLYPGVAELLGGETPEMQDFSIWFEGDDTIYPSDYGPVYRAILTNNTQDPIQGYYAVMTYSEQKTKRDRVIAQIHALDVDLQPGESEEIYLTSQFYGLSRRDVIRMGFESEAERDAFLNNPALYSVPSGYDPLYGVDDALADDWFYDNFGIELKPAK